MLQLSRHFANDRRSHRLEMERRREWFIKAREDQKRREDSANDTADEIVELGMTVVMATEAQIEAFEARLDRLDAATVAALDQNRFKLEEVRHLLALNNQRIQDMLERAHVLDDGRRVFLTDDRLQAFDEFGDEVFRDELDFDAVPENAPTYEAYAEQVEIGKALEAEEQVLVDEQQELLDYQNKLDDARERIIEGDFSKNDLEQLDAELMDAMPVLVRGHMAGYDTESAPNANADLSEALTPQTGKIPSSGTKGSMHFDLR